MIVEIETDEQIISTRDVMLELRPHIAPDDYLPTVRRMMRTDEYRLAAAVAGERLVAVAGYRFIEMLYCGRILVVDDLVTNSHSRSSGHGRSLIHWLKDRAREKGCRELHLNSRVHRAAAHKFYFREGFSIESFHFSSPTS